MKIFPASPALQFKGSPIAYGAYHGAIPDSSTRTWDGNSSIFSSRGTQRKTWLFAGAYNTDYCIGFAIVDTGYIAKAFVYIYNLKEKWLEEDGISLPLGFNKNFDPNIDSEWRLKNYHIYTQNGVLFAKYTGKKFSMCLEVQLNEQGLSFVCPSTGNRPFHYTYKNLLLPAKLELKMGKKPIILDNLQAGIDFSKGYPPRHTFWNWTSFMGKTEDGIPVGINLVDGFNDNIENALWIGQENQLLGKVQYEYQEPLDQSLWTVKNDILELTMQPRGQRRENINLLLLKSKFIQVYGRIEGKILYKGQWKQLKGQGVMEEHEALW